MKKIAVITGTRAEYGLLRPLIQKIINEESLSLQLCVTAMHLSPDFGMTVEEIESNGVPIAKKIETLLSSDTSVGIVKSMGLTMISFSEALEELNPDLVIVLGDRTEILAATTSAYILGIPIAHIHGGETTEGAYDEAIRHSITKMSYWHFTSTEAYRNRVIQLGEHPNRVFNVGAIGLDSIKELELLSKVEFEKSIDFKLNKISFLITYHPETLNNSNGEVQFKELLNAIDVFEQTTIIITMPNSDKGGKQITKLINEYASKNKDKCVVFQSLGQLRYLSALQHVSMVIGNSSSGIIEAPSFNIPTINIGDRQKGRVMPHSVINCEPNKKAIKKSIEKAFTKEFQMRLKNQSNPYGAGNSSKKILEVICSKQKINLKKKFYDIK